MIVLSTGSSSTAYTGKLNKNQYSLQTNHSFPPTKFIKLKYT